MAPRELSFGPQSQLQLGKHTQPQTGGEQIQTAAQAIPCPGLSPVSRCPEHHICKDSTWNPFPGAESWRSSGPRWGTGTSGWGFPKSWHDQAARVSHCASATGQCRSAHKAAARQGAMSCSRAECSGLSLLLGFPERGLPHAKMLPYSPHCLYG